MANITMGNITYGTGTMTWTPTASAVSDQVWHQWAVTTAATTAGYQYNQVWGQWNVYYEQTAEQRQHIADAAQHIREQAAARRLRDAQEIEERVVAHARGLELFKSLLTPEQLDEQLADHQVTVRGDQGGLYRLETGRNTVHGNLVRTDEHGCNLGRLCVAPEMYDHDNGRALPTSDGWVGQLLSIRHNEHALLANANWSGRRACYQAEQRAA